MAKKTKKKHNGNAIKIFKYTKPYLILILFAIGLLFAQANLDLALPNYLSDIVDTGIQQRGVDAVVPIAIREQTMNDSLLFLDPTKHDNITSYYTLVTNSSTNYAEKLIEYPILENESIYIRNEIDNSVINEIDDLYEEPFAVYTSIAFIAENETAALAFFNTITNSSLPALPPGVTLFDLIRTLPYYNLTGLDRVKITQAVLGQLRDIGQSFVEQTAIAGVVNEHEIVGVDGDKIQNRYILTSGGLMVLMTFLSVTCTIIVTFLASRTAAGMARDIRTDLFSRVENFSNIEFDTFSTASLITRSTNDVTQIQNVVVLIIRMVFYAPILGVGGIINALNKNAEMWWLIGVAVGVLLLLILIIVLIAVPRFNKIQKLTDKVNQVARENLTGMLVVRAFNREQHEEDRFDKVNVKLTKLTLFINRVLVVLFPFMMLIMNGLMVWIIWEGSEQINLGAMQVGDMIAFMQYSMQIVFAFLMLTMMFVILPRAIISARRITEVLDTEPVIIDPKEPKKFPEPFRGAIEFQHVSFMYPGAQLPAIQDVSFTAKPGETTAIIGATGSGKTTLINLIPRLYDISRGKILIDGIDIREVTQHDLRDKIGYVPQKSYLFSGTIESNLEFANDEAEIDVFNEALDIAQATEFVKQKEDGIQSEVAQAGANLSGGQKQRLSIARALAKQAPIYIFDDSVSALDFKTDAALRKALKEKTGDSTVIMVTQRVSTIKDAEQILVIEHGQLIGKGTHDELMDTCNVYREIAISQLELEEF